MNEQLIWDEAVRVTAERIQAELEDRADLSARDSIAAVGFAALGHERRADGTAQIRLLVRINQAGDRVELDPLLAQHYVLDQSFGGQLSRDQRIALVIARRAAVTSTQGHPDDLVPPDSGAADLEFLQRLGGHYPDVIPDPTVLLQVDTGYGDEGIEPMNAAEAIFLGRYREAILDETKLDPGLGL